MQRSTKEIEIKLPFDAASDALEQLELIGAAVSKPRQFEDNLVFDREQGSLARAGILLRLRHKGGENTLTLKTPVPGEHRHKVRDETETAVGDFEAMLGILRGAGFSPCFRYQKFRTVLELDRLVICLDETPIGCYVELEGPPDAIDDTAGRLGFSPAQYLRETYFDLHEREARRRGVEVGDLLFDPKEPGASR